MPVLTGLGVLVTMSCVCQSVRIRYVGRNELCMPVMTCSCMLAIMSCVRVVYAGHHRFVCAGHNEFCMPVYKV